MNLKTGETFTTVTLSERNLRHLLDRLESGQRASIIRRTAGTLLTVQAETDAEHYHSDDRDPEVRGEAGIPTGGWEHVPNPNDQEDDDQ